MCEWRVAKLLVHLDAIGVSKSVALGIGVAVILVLARR